MEKEIIELISNYPLASAIYGGLTGLYMLFCAVASLTKNQSDDKIADKLKRFFSLS